jgi:hypothetical protein
MSDLLRVLAGYVVVFGTPILGITALTTGYRLSKPRVPPRTIGLTAVRCLVDRLQFWTESWRLDYRRGLAGRRLAGFVLSFGLLYRAMIHTLVAVGVAPDRDHQINYSLCWTPIDLPRGPLWTARLLTVCSGWCLAVLTGWPVWGWEPWLQWVARGYLFAQLGVWCAEPIAIVRDYARR